MNQKLFIRNLSWSVSENDLYDLFGQAGTVVSVSIPTRREDGKPRGFAFIEMASPEDAQKAIEYCNGTTLDDRDIVVDYQDESRSRGGGNRGGGGGRREAEKSPKLFVRNIDDSVTDMDLQQHFQQIGTVISVKIPTDRDTGAPKGFGFVEMGSADEAEQAIGQLNNSVLGGREIAIHYQDSSRSHRRPSRPGGGGGYGYDRSRSW